MQNTDIENTEIQTATQQVGNNEDLAGSLLGICRQTHDEIYELYCQHALIHGFSVRKHTTRYKKGKKEITERYFVCSCEGSNKHKDNYIPENSETMQKKRRKRVQTKTGCCAYLRSKLREGFCEIIEHAIQHNHPLTRKDLSHYHRSQRKITTEKGEMIEQLHNSGIKTVDSYQYMCSEAGGQELVGHSLKDHYNYVYKIKMSAIEGGDAQNVVQMLTELDTEDSEFFFRVRLDEEGRLSNIFWRDAIMKEDYKAFGDLMVFDTTYRTNKYNLICAPFVGVNNHWKNVMFGCAFLSDEKTESFEWLFTVFKKSMGGLSPTTIFTDQDQAMTNALQKVFPNTRHRLCIWHLQQNAISRFGSLKRDPKFKNYFKKCLSGCVNEEEFISTWNDMMADYNLWNDSWFARLFQLREKWCTALSKDFFSAGILSSQRSESTNHAIGFKASKTTNLTEFFKIFNATVDRWRAANQHDEFQCSRAVKMSSTLPVCSILKHAFDLYTIEIYKMFETEFAMAIACKVALLKAGEDKMKYNIILEEHEKRPHVVEFDIKDTNVACSCKHFEECGWLCCHTLRILHIFSIPEIPEKYIRKRWTKFAKSDVWQNEITRPEISSTSKELTHYRKTIQRNYYNLILRSQTNEMARRYLLNSYDRDLKEINSILLNDENDEETQELTSNSVLNPVLSATKGRKKRIKGHFEKKKKTSTQNDAQTNQIQEFGSYTPNPRLF